MPGVVLPILALIGGPVLSVCPAADVRPADRLDCVRAALGRDTCQDVVLNPGDTIVVP